MRNEKGLAAMIAVFLLATMFTTFISAYLMLAANNRVVARQLSFHGQANNAAQAGLVEALAWFRKQQTQPVATFQPRRDLTADPPLNETDDPSLGLVRDYEISPESRVWARYEVRRTEVQDVTVPRGKSGTGTIWRLVSRGIVYVRNTSDLTVRFDQVPNRVIHEQTATTEIQRLTLVLPGNAGINSSRGDRVSLETRARVFGGTGIGIVYAASTGSPTLCSSPCQVTGSPGQSQANPYRSSVGEVFGLQTEELVSMADYVVTSTAELPEALPDMSLIVINGNATFSPTRPLRGSGILFVLGSLTIQANSASSYNGLIYVTGDYVQNAPSSIFGSVIGGQYVRLIGAGDFAEISFDSSIIQLVQQQMGQYRYSRSVSFADTWR